ncbi:hypothetical protein E2C06_33610 [Dankookia rubra]|uniref:Uncharacterized protein n=1 Tax=Dankookia rubra TaxID=1442381 RepID=A0A4R5Q6S9_9PROT|nr:hypothetical protein [Dankookia rubra]TDH58253.1 hypothetical protein E2C06_33610 [Dankookia rubra]
MAKRRPRKTIERRQQPQAEPPTYGMQASQLARRDVHVGDRADPEDPNRTVRVARRIGMHARLATEGLLTTDQQDAGDEYGRLWEVVNTGLSPTIGQGAGGSDPAFRSHAPELWSAACGKLAKGDAVLRTGQLRAVVQLVVVAGLSAEDAYQRLYPTARPVSNVVSRNRTAGLLVAGLDLLADEWGMSALRRHRTSLQNASRSRI